MDALGSNIRVDTRGAQVMRVLPRLNEDVNEEWISDKTPLRHRRPALPAARPAVCAHGRQARRSDLGRGLRRHRRQARQARRRQGRGDRRRPVRRRVDGGAEGPDGGPRLAQHRLPPGRRQARCGPRGSYIFNPGIRGIEQADAILLIGTNPRWEAPVLNARIRKRYLHGGLPDRQHRPARRSHLSGRAAGRRAGDAARAGAKASVGFFEKLKAAKNPLIIVGMGALARADGAAVLALARELADKLAPCVTTGTALPCCIPRRRASAASTSASCRARAAATSRASWPAARSGEIDVVYLLAADEIDTERLGKAFVIYQGHHGDAGAHRADVILPGAAYTEKNPAPTSTPKAACSSARRAGYPAGRRPRGLGDPARALRASGQDPAVRHAGPGPRAAGGGEHELRRASTSRSAAAWGSFGAAGQLVRRAVRLADRQLLHDLPDQPRLEDDGRVHRLARAAHGGGVGDVRRPDPFLHG